MQRAFADTSYAGSFEIYMERLRADIWTLEMKERNYADIELFKRYKGQRWPKKVALGVISHRNLQVETPEEVAADIRRAMQYIDPEQIVLSTDCGFGRQGCNRYDCLPQDISMVQGANIVRKELGVPRLASARKNHACRSIILLASIANSNYTGHMITEQGCGEMRRGGDNHARHRIAARLRM